MLKSSVDEQEEDEDGDEEEYEPVEEEFDPPGDMVLPYRFGEALIFNGVHTWTGKYKKKNGTLFFSPEKKKKNLPPIRKIILHLKIDFWFKKKKKTTKMKKLLHLNKKKCVCRLLLIPFLENNTNEQIYTQLVGVHKSKLNIQIIPNKLNNITQQ